MREWILKHYPCYMLNAGFAGRPGSLATVGEFNASDSFITMQGGTYVEQRL